LLKEIKFFYEFLLKNIIFFKEIYDKIEILLSLLNLNIIRLSKDIKLKKLTKCCLELKSELDRFYNVISSKKLNIIYIINNIKVKKKKKIENMMEFLTTNLKSEIKITYEYINFDEDLLEKEFGKLMLNLTTYIVNTSKNISRYYSFLERLEIIDKLLKIEEPLSYKYFSDFRGRLYVGNSDKS
jgi:hypothetical protein